LTTALVAWPFFAHGQPIDVYVNSLVQGLGDQPGVTVGSRLHPDYDPTGIHAGLLTVLSSLDETIGYDDNVTGTPVGHGSPRIETNAKLNATVATNDSSLSTILSLDDIEFTKLSDQSYTNWNAGLFATHHFGHDELTFSATHNNQNQTPRDLDLPQLDHPIAYRFDDLKTDYTITEGHLQVQPVMDLQFYNFDNGRVLGVPYAQSYRDRTVYFPSISATYEFADRRRIVLVFRDANALYYNGLAGQPKQNFNDFSLLAGLSYDLDGVIGFRLLGGYEERDFLSHSYKTIKAPIVEGSVTWTPSGLTTVTGTVSRTIEDSAADDTVATTASQLSLKLDHELFRNVIVTAKFGFNSSQYAQNGGTTDLFRTGAGVTWLLNRSLRLEMDYMFSTRLKSGGFEGSEASSTVDQDYADNVFRLGLRLAL